MNIVGKLYIRIKGYGIKQVGKAIVYNKIYRRLEIVVELLSKMIYKKSRLKDIIVLESHNDFDSNGGAFYNYLIANNYNKHFKIVWLIRNTKPKNMPPNVIAFNLFKPSFRKNYYLYTSKYLLSCHQILEKRRIGQIACYMTHGPVGLKAFKGKVILPQNISYCLCPSEYLAPILAEQYMMEYPNNIQVILGYPCHDVLYSAEEGDLKKITNHKYDKVILWMPTFRKSVTFNRNDSNRTLPLGIPIFRNMEEYKRLNDRLKKDNVLLILKLHPMQDLTCIKVNSLSNIALLDGGSVKKLGVDNYRLMKDVDALISDYSSVAYDFLHLDRPVAYTMDDSEDYKLGFIVNPPEKLMAGHIVYTYDDFVGFIEDVIAGKDLYKKARQILFDKVFKYHDGKSSERLAEFLGLKSYIE